MFRNLLYVLILSSVVVHAGDDEPLVLHPKNWETTVPYWGAIEPRSNDGIPEFRLTGGATVISKKDLPAEGKLTLEWFPEVEHQDALTIHLLTSGDLKEGDGPYTLNDGISVTIGFGKAVTRVAVPGKKVLTSEDENKIFNIKLNELVWHTVRIELKAKMTEIYITVDGKEHLASSVEYGSMAFKGRKFGFGNVKVNEQRVAPVSFIRKLELPAHKGK